MPPKNSFGVRAQRKLPTSLTVQMFQVRVRVRVRAQRKLPTSLTVQMFQGQV